MFSANLSFAASTDSNQAEKKTDQKEAVEPGDSLNLEEAELEKNKEAKKPSKNVTKLNRNSAPEEEDEASFLSYNFIFYLIYKFKTTDIFKFIE